MILKNKEIKVVICVIILLLIIEIVFRVVKPHISGDQKHLESLPAMAERLHKYNGFRILLLGNSLIGEAVDIVVLQKGLADGINLPLVEKAVPDGTNFLDWHFLLKNTFFKRKGKPDLLIVGFAWNGAFLDGGKVSDKIIESSCNFADFPLLRDFGFKGFEKTSEAILCIVSSVFTHRETIRNRLLDMIIPNYRVGTQYINSMQNASTIKPSKGNPQYNLFKRYLDLIEKNHVKAVFLAMPVIDDYQVDDELIQLIRNKNVFIDMRYVPGLQKEMFIDPLHLGPQGRKIFSDNLVQKLINENVITATSLAIPNFKKNDIER